MTLWVEGRADYDQARLTVPTWTTNLGVLRLETTQNDGWDRGSYLDCAGGLLNGPSGVLRSRLGSGDGRLVTGYLVNAGRAEADADAYLDVVGSLAAAGGTFTGPIYIHDSCLLVTASPPTPTTLRLRGANNRLLTDNLPGTTLWVEGRVDYDLARLTVLGHAANHGTIHLETTENDGWDRGSYLVATDGVFRNAEEGRIEVVAGQGDARGISTWQFQNAGLLLAADTAVSLTANSGILLNEPTGIIAGSGTLNLGSGTLENQGVVRPGASPGTLTVSGHYLQTPSGHLDIEIGGLTAGTDFDRLAVSGYAMLDGALDVSFLEPFEPGVGENFRVLTCGLLNGQFAVLNAPIWKTNHAFSAVHFVRGVELQTITTGTHQIAPSTGFHIAIGQVVSDGQPAAGAGRLDHPDEQDLFTFTNKTNQRLYFNVLAVSTPAIRWEILDATGQRMFEGRFWDGDAGQWTFAEAGTSTVRVYGDGSATGTCSFTVLEVLAPEEFEVAMGQTVTPGVPAVGAGHIETPGAEDHYFFTSTPGQTVYLEKLAWSPALYWALLDPDGNQLRRTWLNSDLGRFTLSIAGQYRVVAAGSESSVGPYSLKLWGDAPEILSPPQNQTVLAGLGAVFSVTAAYPETITYQWLFDGGELAGETSPVLMLPSVEPNQAGHYSVVVSGPAGSVTSPVATLTVSGPTTGEALVNGSFEFGPNPGAVLTRRAGDTSMVGWEVSGGSIDYVGSYWSPADGSRSLDLDGSSGPGAVSQTFTTLPGVTYQVDFSLAANPDAAGVRHLRVSAAGQSAEYAFDSTGHTRSAMGWTRQAFTFVAISSQTTLSFESLSPARSQTGIALDAVAAVGYLTTHAPDLRVTALHAPSIIIAGQPTPITLSLTNAGVADTPSTWSDAILLADNPAGDHAIPITLIPSEATLAAGHSMTRVGTVIIPGGLSGQRWLVVQADGAFEVPEGYGETNNRYVAPQPVEIIAPDLQVVGLSAPEAALFGRSISVGWTVTNSGTGQASVPWNDRIYLSAARNSTSGAILLATVPGSTVPLQPDGSYTRSQTVTLPLLSGQAPGTHFLVLAADAANAQPESSEGNNLVSRPIALDLPPLPDLVASGIVAPPLALAGENVVLTWNITNSGDAEAVGIWSETVSLSPDALVGNDSLLATFRFTNSIPAGGFLVRTQSVAIPLAGATGDLRFVVTMDHDNDVIEQDENNNAALADAITPVPALLTLQLPVTQLVEGAPTVYGTVTRNGDRSQPLTVALESSDTTELRVPTDVVVAAGHARASFGLTAPGDAWVDGPQSVLVTATAAGFLGATNPLTVLDTNVPGLQLVIFGDTAREGDVLDATVSRSVVTDQPLVVILGSSGPNQLSAPARVTIQAHAASAAFSVTAVDDSLCESARTYSITAAADGFDPSLDTVTVLDNDVPELALSLSADTLSESAGSAGVMATVTRSVSGLALAVRLHSSDTTEAMVPATAEIAAGESSVSVPVTAVDDALLDGPQRVVLTASVAESLSGNPIAPAAAAELTVTDNDGPTLTVVLARDVVAEGLSPATSATVTRNTPSTNALVVAVQSSDTTEAIVPATVTLPAGAATASFDIASVADGVADGSQAVTLSAHAGGFTGGSDTLVITDIHLPDLVISNLNAPTNGLTESTFNLTYREANLGLTPAQGTWAQVVWLSQDALAGEDELLGRFDFSGLSTTLVGLHDSLDVQVELPSMLPGLEAVPLTLLVRSLTDEPLSDSLHVLVFSAQGTSNRLSVTANVEPLRPRLTAVPGSLVAGMLRGGQTIVSFQVGNEGGAESGPLNLIAPALNFLHVATPLPLPSLAPGASNTVTLQLNAAPDQPLGEYSGNLIVSGADAGVSVPYRFRALSEARGDLVVEAVDEYTYYADGAPRLAGASVRVLDALSNDITASGVTGTNGVFTATGLREGYYNLVLTAEQHSVYRGLVLVSAGATTHLTAFLSRQAVQYLWKVEPTEIDDRTRITLTTTFETFVPMPVVTLEPTMIDLLDYPADKTQIDLKVTNHGLIAAQDARLSFPELAGWRFTPLVTELGDLPARSSFTIPLLIERTSLVSGKQAPTQSGGACGGIGQLIYSLICGPASNDYGTPVHIVNAADGCGGGGVDQCLGWRRRTRGCLHAAVGGLRDQ